MITSFCKNDSSCPPPPLSPTPFIFLEALNSFCGQEKFFMVFMIALEM